MNDLKKLLKGLKTEELEAFFELVQLGVKEKIDHMTPSPKTTEMFGNISASLEEIAIAQKRESRNIMIAGFIFVFCFVVWTYFYLPMAVERVVSNMELIEVE